MRSQDYLDIVAVAAVVTVPEQHAHGGQRVGLAELHHDGTRSKLRSKKHVTK